jgi:hypothetical protein
MEAPLYAARVVVARSVRYFTNSASGAVARVREEVLKKEAKK